MKLTTKIGIRALLRKNPDGNRRSKATIDPYDGRDRGLQGRTWKKHRKHQWKDPERGELAMETKIKTIRELEYKEHWYYDEEETRPDPFADICDTDAEEEKWSLETYYGDWDFYDTPFHIDEWEQQFILEMLDLPLIRGKMIGSHGWSPADVMKLEGEW